MTDRTWDELGGAVAVEAAHMGLDVWPVLLPATGSVHLVRRADADLTAEPRIIWERDLGASEAATVFEYMCHRRDQWPLWGRVACLFAAEAVDRLVLDSAYKAAEEVAVAAEMQRLEEADRLRRREIVDLYILDPKGRRPGLALETAEAKTPFFTMNFSERWERERVLDWMRCQKSRYREFRNLCEAEGSAALERAIIAGMRETEADVKRRGLTSGGRRPLRFWRGE